MGNPVYQTINSTGTSTPVSLDWTLVPFNAAFAVELQGNTTATYKVEFTLDNVNDNTTATWFESISAPANSTTSLYGTFTAPVTFTRVNCSALSANGTIRFAVVQGIPV